MWLGYSPQLSGVPTPNRGLRAPGTRSQRAAENVGSGDNTDEFVAV